MLHFPTVSSTLQTTFPLFLADYCKTIDSRGLQREIVRLEEEQRHLGSFLVLPVISSVFEQPSDASSFWLHQFFPVSGLELSLQFLSWNEPEHSSPSSGMWVKLWDSPPSSDTLIPSYAPSSEINSMGLSSKLLNLKNSSLFPCSPSFRIGGCFLQFPPAYLSGLFFLPFQLPSYQLYTWLTFLYITFFCSPNQCDFYLLIRP